MAEDRRNRGVGRRAFLQAVSAAAAGVGLAVAPAAAEDASTAAAPMPSIPLGPHRISRLVAGWNPIAGNSHSTLDLSNAMREYFTLERSVAFLQDCERRGITAWQYSYADKAVAILRQLREAGSKLKVICLHAEGPRRAPLRKVIDDTAPIAIAHHGNVTDALLSKGNPQPIREFLKKVRDHGLLAGVSTHSPENLRRIAAEGWECDFFMASFYYITRSADQQRKQLGKVALGEPFFESDPAEMTAAIRVVEKPCLAFKILGAGRRCWSAASVEEAFRYAFANIKPADAVIVGMFPRYGDQVGHNAALARRFGVTP